MSDTLQNKIRDAVKDDELQELIIRRVAFGWQAVAIYRGRIKGPWGVGCDDDPADAADKALDAGRLTKPTPNIYGF